MIFILDQSKCMKKYCFAETHCYKYKWKGILHNSDVHSKSNIMTAVTIWMIKYKKVGKHLIWCLFIFLTFMYPLNFIQFINITISNLLPKNVSFITNISNLIIEREFIKIYRISVGYFIHITKISTGYMFLVEYGKSPFQ